MAENNHRASSTPSSIDTLVGAGMRIEGKVVCAGVLRLQGEILGDVLCCDKDNSSGFLVVDGSGRLTGRIEAPHVAVRGQVTGPLHSSQTIEVCESGNIQGDLSFNQLTVQSGGVIDGLLKPMSKGDSVETNPGHPPRVSSAMADIPQLAGTDVRPARSRSMAGVVTAVVFLAIAAVWGGQRFLAEEAPTDKAALKAEAFMRETQPKSVAASPEPKPAVQETVVVAAQPAVKPDAQVSRPADTVEREQGKIVMIRGANPSRPAGVFLLVPNEATVLYRKKIDETGEGVRFPIAQGEKISVAISRDELIRVAKGTDVVIFFQGQKVPSSAIESGSWMRFEPR